MGREVWKCNHIDGPSRVRLSSTEPHPLAGTDGAFRPFWSPDSQWIGFATDGAIKKIDRAGSGAIVIAAVGNDHALSSAHLLPAALGVAKPPTKFNRSFQ